MSQEINLLGTQIRRQRRAMNSAVVLGPVLLVAVVAGLGAGMFLKHQARVLREQHAANEDVVKREQDRQRKLAQEVAQLKKDPALEAEAVQIERRLQAIRLDVGALKDGVIGDTRGISDFMHALARQAMDGVWLTGFSVSAAGQNISITGRALRAELVPAYLKRLGQDPYFSGRTFAGLDIMPARGDARAESQGSSALAFNLMSRRDAVAVESAAPARSLQ